MAEWAASEQVSRYRYKCRAHRNRYRYT